MGLHLVIGNKNYSSWSFRPWIAMTVAGIPFEETVVSLDDPDFKARVGQHSGTGKVPVLIDGEVRIWESLAILEYVAETHPEAELWPAGRAERAHARAVATEMSSVNQRLFNNAYFRSVDALLMLASYRLSSLLEWMPWLIPLMLAAGIDGLLLRVVWSKEFLLHDPEMFAVWCSLSIIAGCVTVVAFVLPVQWHPAMLAGSPIAMTMLLGRAIMHFHRRA